MARDIAEWFGLSYAHYLVIPRSQLQAMPEWWQNGFTAMLKMLEKYVDTTKNGDGCYYMVRLRGENGVFMDDYYNNYRYPNKMKRDGVERLETEESLRRACKEEQ